MSNIHAHWGDSITVYERDTLNGGDFITSEVSCSNCGYTVPIYKKTLFCAGCGARMDEQIQVPDAPPYKIGDEDYWDRVICERYLSCLKDNDVDWSYITNWKKSVRYI